MRVLCVCVCVCVCVCMGVFDFVVCVCVCVGGGGGGGRTGDLNSYETGGGGGEGGEFCRLLYSLRLTMMTGDVTRDTSDKK